MKKLFLSFRQMVLLSLCSILFTITATGKNTLPIPKIQQGIAKVSGKIIGFQPKEKEPLPPLIMYVPNPVTGERQICSTVLKADGSFFFEVPIQSSITIGIIEGSIMGDHNISISTCLECSKETKLDILLNGTGRAQAKMTSPQPLTSYDMTNIYNRSLWGKLLIPFENKPDKPIYKMEPDEYFQYMMGLIKDRIQNSLDGFQFSEGAQTFIANQYKIVRFKPDFMYYADKMSSTTWEKPADFIPQESNLNYYRFLKEFNLNDPQYLYNDNYYKVFQSILADTTLNIPAIGDTPVEDWLKIVKDRIADLVGFDKGLFYDLLTANAYARQFNEEIKPLTSSQKENIQRYFTKGERKEIAKMLLDRNEQIIRLDAAKTAPIVNQTPDVAKEKLMDAIIAKYKGKAVVVDFWATWCSPCMEAIAESGEVKLALKGKNVVFVYITNSTSPKTLWDKTIPNIGGEHYYLNAEEWEYLMDSYGFSGIPSYLFYDADGAFKGKQVGYPGNSKMEEIINRLLH